MKYILAFILTLCLSVFWFLSCDDTTAKHTTMKKTGKNTSDVVELKDQNTEGTIVSSVRSYSRIELENPAHYYLQYDIQRFIYIDGDNICIPTGNYSYSGETGTTVLKYNTDGTLLSEIKIPFKSSVLQERPLSNGTFLYFRSVGESNTATEILICDADKNILYQTALSTYEYNIQYQSLMYGHPIHIDERDDGTLRILVNAYDKLYYLDEQLQILNTVELDSEYAGIHMETDGVYVLGNELPRMCRVDMNAGTLERITTMPVPPEMIYFSKYQYGEDGNLYCLYENYIYRCDGDRNLTEILNWNNGPYDGHGRVWIIDDKHILYCPPYSAVNSASDNLVFLDIKEEDDIQNRRVVTLANLGGLDSNAWLREVIAQFNAQSEDYFVSLKEIPFTATKTTLDAFNDDILANGTPDIAIFSGSYDSNAYMNKGLLLDLSPYFGDELLGCAKTAYTQSDGSQYLLPLSMTVSTYAAASSVLDQPLSWEQMYTWGDDLAKNPGELRAITSSLNPYDFMQYLLADFYDYDGKTADFDTEAFKKRIRFLEAMEKQYVISDYGSLGYGGIYGYRYVLHGGTRILDAVKTGDVSLLEVPFHTVEAYAALKLIFGDTPFTLCGYPTEDGGAPGAYVRGSNLLAVFADSLNLGGCKAFIDFALSLDVQSSEYLTNQALPVTRAALEKSLSDYRYLYYPKEFRTSGSVIGGIKAESALTLSAEKHAAQKDDSYLMSSYRAYEMTEEDRAAILDFFDTCVSGERADTVIWGIVTEELSAYQAGAKTLDDAAALIQNRVWIYLNE
ncbi:MAG: extracellular solute-binding protein [Clostridia bacterium]|nr:extracellular solute-binding protein [Clostridia bacterium]